MLVRHDRRTLHDILAGTRIVRKSEPAVEYELEEENDPDPDPVTGAQSAP
jgi:hypothetical protein